jgi:2-polyprenyl-6-methoxyphenol hydroxylase-like FAD-dependent oxidoreductase
VPVLVAGAGPAGLTAAITQACQGVPCLLVERRTELASLPRATVISVRSMELFRAWGLDEALLAGATEVEWQQWHCRTLAQAADGHATPTGHPTREQSAMLSPCAPACVPQDHLEPVLLDALRALPAARVALGVEVLGVEHGRDGGVRVRTRRTADGARHTIEARYLVAADGAHSHVRDTLGIAMAGPDDLARAVSTVFRAPLSEVVGEHRYGLYAVEHPDHAGVVLPAGRGDRWLYGMFLPGGGAAWPPAIDEAALVRRIRGAAGVPALRPRIERTGAFRFAAQVAERFRAGDAFLVGDAAHRATPRGGTGMNTAIHDGHDLGFRLAWVVRGWAPPSLLDGYERERRPVVEHTVARSAAVDGTARAADEELHADLGGRLTHAWVTGADRRVSTLDLLGPGLTLLAGPDGERWGAAAAAAASGPPVAVHTLNAIVARALGIGARGARLVRPDGATVMWAPGDDDAAGRLRSAIATATTAAPRLAA